MKRILILFLFFSTLINAQKVEILHPISKQKELTEEELKFWVHKDPLVDTIAGVSLDRAYKELLVQKKGKEVIVAVLDTKLDIHHEDIKDRIWTNDDEIPDNGIDDDNNGYVDDIHGWDFLSNTTGDYLKYQNLETVRIVRRFEDAFKDKTLEDVLPEQREEYEIYRKARNLYIQTVKEENAFIAYAKQWIPKYEVARTYLKTIFPKEDYTVATLDSVLTNVVNDTIVKKHAELLKTAITYDITPKYFKETIQQTEISLKTTYNIQFDEREIIGDDPDDFTNNHYGSAKVDGDVPFEHSTSVSGTLAATRNNSLGGKGFSDYIKIMPVVMVSYGDEHDKDVALAIRYAVDNGAKVINMSWGKDFSLYQD